MWSASRRTEFFGLSPAGTEVLRMSVCLEVGGQAAFVIVVQVSIAEHLPEPLSGVFVHHHLLVADSRVAVFALVSQHCRRNLHLVYIHSRSTRMNNLK